MAQRIVSVTTIAPATYADGATNLVDATYPFILQGGGGTQRINILEIFMGGQATSSSPAYMILSRDGQVATGSNTLGAGQADSAMDASTAALALPPFTGNTNATNKPQRALTGHLLNLSFNAFGGIVKWQAPPIPNAMPTVLGNTTPLGEVSLSNFTGGSATATMGVHMIYEPL